MPPAAQPIVFPGFVGAAYSPQNSNLDNQRLMNWYPENAESPAAKAPNNLLPTPGFDDFLTLSESPIRGGGLFTQNDRTFAVAGAKLFELYRNQTSVERTMTAISDPSAPTITNSPVTPAIAAPDPPVISQGGVLGTTAYGYQVTATNTFGETEASTEGTTSNGNATLSALNFNVVNWDPVEGATGYKVYRTTGGSAPPKLIAVTAASVTIYLDTGTVGTAATPPVTNTTEGTPGATTYGYKVVATLGTSQSAASGEGTTLTGQATLDVDNFNTITWPAVTNAGGYKVYRTTGTPTDGENPPRLIATVNASTLSVEDIGQIGTDETPSAANDTGTATIFNDGAPVMFASSGDAGNQILIVSGGYAFCLDLTTNTLAPVVNGATRCGYIGSYFVVLDAASSTMKVSESLDGFQWDSTQVYQRTIAGDSWLSMEVTNSEIWLVGSQTTEIWVATGDNNTRFAPNTNVFIEWGIMAASSLTRFGTQLMWLGQNKQGAGIVVQSDGGYNVRQASSRTVEHALQSYSTLADAVSFSYQQDGHTFYVLTFPTDDATWVYDILTNEWHERGDWNSADMVYEAWRPQSFCFAWGGLGFGTLLAGDSTSGKVMEMSLTTGTDMAGNYIRRVRRCPHLSQRNELVRYSGLEVELLRGQGTTSGQGEDPMLMMRYSNDGGITFGNEIWRSAGRRGAYRTRVRWNRCGIGDDRVFEFVATDPVPWRITGAYLVPRGASQPPIGTP